MAQMVLLSQSGCNRHAQNRRFSPRAERRCLIVQSRGNRLGRQWSGHLTEAMVPLGAKAPRGHDAPDIVDLLRAERHREAHAGIAIIRPDDLRGDTPVSVTNDDPAVALKRRQALEAGARRLMSTRRARLTDPFNSTRHSLSAG
ncbi:hypothetical protein MBELCI_0614 [Limimaricola cinnabarinus LL-001]|uniref:Uncharacterized protein n=1 Tax=Limimaricola cinnabarinus LL-001 TaxID=1337093 RepID=U2Z0E9_9RHOB|nr:hypothetical protein MBELCI_0614 [Limimaricola cinnabarinus LL-001]